jgi:holin-like protein
MLGFFIILPSCQLAGEVLVIATGLPVPGPVVGMALLFAGLLVRGGIPGGPAGVGVMLHARLIGAELLPIAGAVVLATMLTIVVTIIFGSLTAAASSVGIAWLAQ